MYMWVKVNTYLSPLVSVLPEHECLYYTLYVLKCVCLLHLQEKNNARVWHGVWETQNSTAHDGVAQVEDRHPKGGFPLKLENTSLESQLKTHGNS